MDLILEATPEDLAELTQIHARTWRDWFSDIRRPSGRKLRLIAQVLEMEETEVLGSVLKRIKSEESKKQRQAEIRATILGMTA